MDLYQIPDYVVPLLRGFSDTVISLDWTKIILNTIIFFIVMLFVLVFLIVFFDQRMLERFFSMKSQEYVWPLIFYLIALWIIYFIKVQNSMSTVFFEILFIILIVKIIGVVNAKTGELTLQILGGFALIEIFLSPIGNLENIDSELVVPLIINSSLMIIFIGSKKREKVIKYYKEKMDFIINWLLQENKRRAE